MKTLRLFGMAIVPLVVSCGCSTMSNTDKGTLEGGAIGAGTGAIIGHAAGNTGAGALIGAGVGALSGGLIGHAVDKQEEKAAAAAQAQQQIGMTEIVQMTQQHVSDPVIISQIRASHSIYQLSAQDTIWLKQNGVSDRVVQEMMATAYRYPRRVYTAAPAYAQPVYVVEQPPPVSVGGGFGYGSCSDWR